MIIILVNSLVVLQKYTEQTIENTIEKIRSEAPIHVKAFTLPNGSIGVYNGETRKVHIKYLLLYNSTILKRDLFLDPLRYTYINNNSDVIALITEDSHVIPVEEKEIQQSNGNACLFLKRSITGLIGDGYLSRLYEYTIFPELNGFGVKKKTMYTYSKFIEASLDKINKDYGFFISPLLSRSHVKKYIIRGGYGIVYVNLTNGIITKVKNFEYNSFRINMSLKLSNTKSVYLIPVNNRIVLDDEKAILTYDIDYHTNLRRLYLYVNGSLVDTIRSNNLYSMGSVFHVTLNKTLRNSIYLSINSINLNYSITIPYAYGTSIELRVHSELRTIDVNVTIELHPSIVVIPPKKIPEYTININNSKEVYAVFGDPFRYYTLHIYPKSIVPLKRVSFWTKGNGTVLNSREFGDNVVLIYSYSRNYTTEITLGTLLSVIVLYHIGNSRYLFYYIIPILSNDFYVTEIYKEQYKSQFHIRVYENNWSIYSYTFSSPIERIYLHYPFGELQMYNYIHMTGNALLEYPVSIDDNYNTLIQSKRFNITRSERLNIDQYGALNGSVTHVKLCLSSSLSGYLLVMGKPGTIFYLVIPPGINLEPDNTTYVSQNYILSKIPDEGKLVIPFTVLSKISP